MDETKNRAAIECLHELLEFGRGDVAKALHVDGDPYERVLIVALFSRATTTLEALALLCEHGFGQQALMLNRAVFELMVDAYWIDTGPELANERFVKHARFHQQLKRGLGDKYPELRDGESPGPGLDAEELATLKDLYSPYGIRSWTGLSIYERLRAIEDQLDPSDQRQLWFFHDVVHRLNNEELHPTSWSVSRVLRHTPEAGGTKMVQFRIGPEPALCDLALRSAWWMYLQLLHLVISVFDAPLGGELDRLAAKGAAVLGLDEDTGTREEAPGR